MDHTGLSSNRWLLPPLRRPEQHPGLNYRFHSVAAQSLADSSEHQRRDLSAALEQHLRRHRTAKRTTAFIGEFRGPWKNLSPLLLAVAPAERRAQLTLLLWTLTTADN